MAETAQVDTLDWLGIGRPVKYVQVPLDQVKQGMLDTGIPGSFVEYFMDMYTEQAALIPPNHGVPRP